MTSRFTQIDLAKLPAPDVIETIDYEVILEDMKASAIEVAPELEEVLELESEPAVKVLQVCAYYVMLARARVNDAGRAVMLAFAGGTDLDHLGALLGVERAVIDDGDPDAVPPVPLTLEDDDRFRDRIQLSLEGFSTAGPVGAYKFHALSASPQVHDVAVTSPEPGEVRVTILSKDRDNHELLDGTWLLDGSKNLDGTDPDLLDAVEATLNADDVRPLTDLVVVQSATFVPYRVEAELEMKPGPDAAVVLAEAEQAMQAYVDKQYRLGATIARSGLYAALHREGVRLVDLIEPARDLELQSHEAGDCTDITLTIAGAAA